MFDFNNKKILFIGPKTFNYEKEIKQELETLGSEVTYLSDKPFNNILLIILLRIFPVVLWPFSKKIYLKKTALFKKNYFDVIFIIKGEGVSPSLLRWFKQNHTKAYFIFYLWDSIKNVKKVKNKFIYFDKILSFDPIDCKTNNNIIYRPLFFINDYKNKYSNIGEGLFFLGTLNGDRRIVVSKINNLITENIKFDFFLLVRSRIEMLLYDTKKVFCKTFQLKFYDIPTDRLIHQPMNVFDINSKISKSNAVLDIQHINQSGLTMRTFEVLASGKKLITTNKNIINHDFYDPTLILVIDRLSPHIDLDFLKSKSNRINEMFFEKYSCSGWLKEIFDNNKI
jgi:hypothetical protein